MTLPSGWFDGETAPVLTMSTECRARVSAFNATSKFAIVDLRKSYTVVSPNPGGADGVAGDGLLVLDEFDASGAANVSWALHTQANVSISGMRR